MRTISGIIIFFLITSIGASQTYRVSFYENTPVYFSNTKPLIQKEIVNTYTDEQGNIFYIGNYVSTGNSFIKKFSLTGEEIFSYDFAARLFVSYQTYDDDAVATGKLIKTPLNRFLLVCQNHQGYSNYQRVICFDSTFQSLWDVTAPPNPEGVSYMIKDISFDENNNIYLLSDVGNNGSYNGYTNVHLYKYSVNGNIIWEKIINTSPFAMTYNKIVKMKSGSFVIAITRATYYKNFFTLYEIDKATGNTLKYNLYSDNPSYIGQFDCKELNGSYYLAYTTDLWADLEPHSFVRKYNSNLDSVWSRKDASLSTTYSLQTDNAGHIIALGNPYAIAYDTNGMQWWKTNTFPSVSSFKTSEGFALTRSETEMPAFTNIEFNGGLLANSEIYNPPHQYFYPKHLFLNPSNSLQFINSGEVQEAANQNYLYFNNFEKTGALTYSKAENAINESASDLKYFNSNIFISGISLYSQNDISGFVNKYSYTGSLLWSSNVFSHEKSGRINKVVPTSQETFAGGEIYDTFSGKNFGFISGLDFNGNSIFRYSFKNILNKESSVKFITSYYTGGTVFSAGQYKDSLGRTKVFIAKNSGNENIWIKTLNPGNTNDSIVSFSLDQFYNSCVSYNSYVSDVSTKYTVTRFNTSGETDFNFSKEESAGIILKKTIFDGFASFYNFSTIKGSTYTELLTEKFDTNGTILWTDRYSSNTNYTACDIVTDINSNITLAANFDNGTKADVFTMKLSKDGERMWSKVYNSQNKFLVKKISTDDLCCYYISGFYYDAAGNKTNAMLEYDRGGTQRNFMSFNQRNTSNLLSFEGDYFDNIVTNVEAGQKKMFTVTNVNRINTGSDVKVGFFSAYVVSANKNQTELPTNFSLQQNYPNPFNPNTVITYKLPHAGNIVLNIYDAGGRLIKAFDEGSKQAGSYSINFSGVDLASGIYYYSLFADGVLIDTKKSMLIK